MENKKYLESEFTVLSTITEFFIAVIVVLFPLLVDSTGYSKILEFKWTSYVIIMVFYLTILISVIIYFTLLKKVNLFKYIKLSLTQKMFLVLSLIAILTTISSPFFKDYNLFIGSARREGLITILLYMITFLATSIFIKFNNRQMIFFSISSILFSFICIIQYFGLNPFNLYRNGIGTHNVSFIGTIGNLDFVSAYYTIVISVSLLSFIFCNNKKWIQLIHLASIIMGLFIFQIIDVDSGKIGFLSITALVIPYIILNSKYLYRSLIVLSGIVFGFFIDYVFNLKYYYDIEKLKFEIQFNKLALLLIMSCVLLLVFAIILKENGYNVIKNKKYVVGMYILMAVSIIVALVVIYIVDFNISILHEMHEMLHLRFKDEFGTYRIFLWKRAISLVKEYPLFGTGCDSFAIRFMSKYTNDIASLGKITINDTAANVYLTFLVNIGIIGCLIYIIALAKLLLKALKKILNGSFMKDDNKRDNTYYLFALVSICYLVQDFFNLWVVLMTPLFFITIGICENLKEDNSEIE